MTDEMSTMPEQQVTAPVAQQTPVEVLAARAQDLILFRLRCAQTANGLSHYYMYGDVASEETLL